MSYNNQPLQCSASPNHLAEQVVYQETENGECTEKSIHRNRNPSHHRYAPLSSHRRARGGAAGEPREEKRMAAIGELEEEPPVSWGRRKGWLGMLKGGRSDSGRGGGRGDGL